MPLAAAPHGRARPILEHSVRPLSHQAKALWLCAGLGLVSGGMSIELDQWFSREILPHEPALTRYLNRMWRGHAEVADLRQETYIRVYERAARGLPRLPRAFLFVTAHNLVIDRIRRERTVCIAYKPDPDSYDCRMDELTPERNVSITLRHLVDGNYSARVSVSG